MGFSGKASHVTSVIGLLVKHPRQARHVPEWWRRVHEPTIESRLPWIPFDAIDRLERELSPTSRVFEFGGGGSTMWLAERAGTVVTVEHDDEWYDVLAELCGHLPNVRVEHRPDLTQESYTRAVTETEFGGDWDVVIVDGRERVRCLEAAASVVKPGGVVVLDDTDRERYASAFRTLAGWPCETFRGLAPMKQRPGQTTFWRRPD